MKEQILSRATLNPSDKKLLEDVITKTPSELNESEVAIVRARRMYLTAIEKATFEEVLEGEEVKKAEKKEEKKEVKKAEKKEEKKEVKKEGKK